MPTRRKRATPAPPPPDRTSAAWLDVLDRRLFDDRRLGMREVLARSRADVHDRGTPQPKLVVTFGSGWGGVGIDGRGIYWVGMRRPSAEDWRCLDVIREHLAAIGRPEAAIARAEHSD